jgi:BolA family transcriptional regulator, general stress-responsive regulator
MSANTERLERIEARLHEALKPATISLRDDSHLHAGHAGARSGRGHFHAEITAEAFRGLTPIARHRAVYAALGELMETDIHALSMTLRVPDRA